ncbi:DUF86 domain-containing protein [Olsenella sp. YH-ols2217]|uniref:DUF86 domain-containing protein n=1 Tax=Kribbibacterium absianum TaxID=3044210 RepID=A0ABT6ZMX2_9ACTN|nr:HepT-like ribonuclease domain-containing protein [Olsenella sp. YH-ols2217]MDJ1129853.1 DUF86 domain-containing protein [Olsenella sp. YH-ols2217]
MRRIEPEEAMVDAPGHCRRVAEMISRHAMDADSFLADYEYQYMLTMAVRQVIEQSSHFPTEFRAAHPEVPWSKLKRLRNDSAHDYVMLDNEWVWEVASGDVPAIARILEAELTARGVDIEAELRDSGFIQ